MDDPPKEETENENLLVGTVLAVGHHRRPWLYWHIRSVLGTSIGVWRVFPYLSASALLWIMVACCCLALRGDRCPDTPQIVSERDRKRSRSRGMAAAIARRSDCLHWLTPRYHGDRSPNTPNGNGCVDHAATTLMRARLRRQHCRRHGE